MPLVSAVIPTYNREALLRRAVASVLGQTLDDWELLVVDDGSTDATAPYLASLADPRLRLVSLPHTGSPARARNAGLDAAGGTYVAFLDSDDEWSPEKLELQVAVLRQATGARWSYTAYQLVDGEGAPIALRAGGPWRPYSGWILDLLISTEASAPVSTLMAERTLLLEAGGFDEDPRVRFREDYDLLFRCAMLSPAAAVDRVLGSIREHPERSTGGRDDLHETWIQVYRKLRERAGDARIRALCDQRCARLLADLANHRSLQGRHRDALATSLRGLRYRPTMVTGWSAVARCLLRAVRGQR